MTGKDTNKMIFARNLNRFMEAKKVSRYDVAKAVDSSYFAVSDWCRGYKYPRMDKVERLAEFFGVMKSDLIEEKLTEEQREDNEILANIIIRMRTDDDFRQVVESIYRMDSIKFSGAKQMLETLELFTK